MKQDQEYFSQEALRQELKRLGFRIGYSTFKALKLAGMPRIEFGRRSTYHLPTVLKWMEAKDGSREDSIQAALDKIARKVA